MKRPRGEKIISLFAIRSPCELPVIINWMLGLAGLRRSEDSPYLARQPFSDASVEELAQAMREAGFQGVLIAHMAI
jgi:hypothetical protein